MAGRGVAAPSSRSWPANGPSGEGDSILMTGGCDDIALDIADVLPSRAKARVI